MADEALRRTDALLTELIDLVETARALPMSLSCVLPRERMLDLLDELREVVPPEVDEARTVIARRDALIKDAYETAAATRERAVTEADAVLADAAHRAEALVTEATERAHELAIAARDEHARLVSSTAVHQAAAQAATALRQDAEAYQRQIAAEAAQHDAHVREGADRYAHDARTEAERYAMKLTVDAEDYAERTLDELSAVLGRAAQTAEQGRSSLAARRAGQWTSRPPRADDAAEVDDTRRDDVHRDDTGAPAEGDAADQRGGRRRRWSSISA